MARHQLEPAEMNHEDLPEAPGRVRRWFYLYLVIAGLVTMAAIVWVLLEIDDRQRQLEEQGFIEEEGSR